MTCIVALRRITLLLILVFFFSYVIRTTLCIDIPLSRQISVVDWCQFVLSLERDHD